MGQAVYSMTVLPTLQVSAWVSYSSENLSRLSHISKLMIFAAPRWQYQVADLIYLDRLPAGYLEPDRTDLVLLEDYCDLHLVGIVDGSYGRHGCMDTV